MSISFKNPIMDIYFRVWGDELDPESITHILKIEPTEAFKKGEEKIGEKTGTKVKIKTGRWFLETRKHVHSNFVTDHIQFILSLLRGLERPLYGFKGVEKLRITFVLGVNEETNDIEFELNPDLLREIVQQNIELSFAII